MRKVLFELKDKSGSVLLNIKYNQNEVDSMSDLALKQHAGGCSALADPGASYGAILRHFT